MSGFGSITSKEIIQTIEDLRKMKKTTGYSHIHQDICDHFSMLINNPPESELEPEKDDIPDITA